MTVLTSELDPGTAAAQDNRRAMLAAIERIGGLAGQITRGGSEASLMLPCPIASAVTARARIAPSCDVIGTSSAVPLNSVSRS